MRKWVVALAAVGVVVIFATAYLVFAKKETPPPLATVETVTSSSPIALPGAVEFDIPITITFVGDIMFDRNVRARMEQHGEAYPLHNIQSASAPPFKNVDLLIGNLEGAISRRREPVKLYDFAFDDSTAALLRDHGFTAVSLANNHALDQGRQGMIDTEAALAQAGVGFFGDQVRDDTPAWTTEVRGKRIAFFGYNITDNTLEPAVAKKNIEAAASTHDYVIVFMHWGAEYVPRPAHSIVELGREFIDWGASAVIGAHPHVMQGMELWRGKPILWSLGNFVFDQDWSEETQRGLVVTLSLGTDEPRVEKIDLHPATIIRSQPALAEGDERVALLKRFAERSTLSPKLMIEAENGSVTLHK